MIKNLFFIPFFVCVVQQIYAQKTGIGIQFGEPTGLNLRLNNNQPMSIDILAAWDFDDYLFVNVHGLWQKPLSGSPKMKYYYGPGGFLAFKERTDNTYLGVSGTLGLSLYIERFEIYAQITPKLSLTPDTDGDVGGGLGFRFYLN